jgi:TRAP-type mannitol/chloroaromatic compound transport system permease large subunit
VSRLGAPTEAAIGVVSSLLLAEANRKLTVAILQASRLSTVQITATILLVLIGAFFFNFSMGSLGIRAQISVVARPLAADADRLSVLFYCSSAASSTRWP